MLNKLRLHNQKVLTEAKDWSISDARTMISNHSLRFETIF